MSKNIEIIGAGGNVQSTIRSYGMDPGKMRPFLAEDGETYVTVFKGGDRKNPKNYVNKPIQANTDTTLRRDEWKALDDAVNMVARERLVGIADLRSRGLVYTLNGMSRTVLESHNMSDSLKAELSMNGATRGNNDRPVFSDNYLPLPISHSDFQLDERELAISRNMGDSLDIYNAEMATRRVAEQLEDMLFTDTSYTFGGGTIYSYLNQPNRNTYTLASGAWDGSGVTGEDIKNDVLAMKQLLRDAKMFGQMVLYIPTEYETVMDDDYVTTMSQTKTIRQRILEIDGIVDIKVADRLTADNVILVVMSSNVVRLVDGMGFTNVLWNSEGGMVHNFKVMTIQVPQIRADYDGNSGVVHATA